MRLHGGIVALLALAVVAAASGEKACAQDRGTVQLQPAVSALNGKFALEGGAVGSNGRSAALGAAEGSIAVPLGTHFGAQLDGFAATTNNLFLGGGTAHVFWRDPQVGLVGPIAALMGGGGATIGLYGGEGQLYAGMFSLGGVAGYMSATSPSGNVPSGGLWQGTLTFYPISDLALTAGGGQAAGAGFGLAQVEYQPEFIAGHNMSFFVDSDIGENGYYRVTGGVRFFFGPEKTLMRRQREDDPPAVWYAIKQQLIAVQQKISSFQPTR